MTGGASPRRRGDYHERKVRANLEKHGWLVVRSAGSLGPADLIAIHHARMPVLVSCKISGKVPPAEWDELYLVAMRHGAHAIVASRPKDGVIRYQRIDMPKPLRPSRNVADNGPWSPQLTRRER